MTELVYDTVPVMCKKKLQQKRMMRYFIEAARTIIEQEGLDSLTIRKVADLAGYNVATLYRYFKNIDNLIAFTALKNFTKYIEDLKQCTVNIADGYELYIKIWRCFCYHSFNNPRLYHRIFFKEFRENLDTSIQEYYTVFPEELAGTTATINDMLIGERIEDRTCTVLERAVSEGFFDRNDMSYISEGSVLLYEGMLDKIISGAWNKSIDEAVRTTIYHLEKLLSAYRK